MDAHHLTAVNGFGGVRQQRLAILLLRHLRGVLEQRVERAPGGDEIARALLTDTRHTLHVVDGVAHQGQHVHHLLGRHAELLLHARRVVPGAVIARVEDPDVLLHQLVEVLVAGDDHHVVAVGHAAHGHGADHVVGFITLAGDDRHAQRLAGLMHERNLACEVVRHRRAVRLVVGSQVVAERAAGEIERGGDVRRCLLLDQLPEHVHEDVDRIRGDAAGVAEQGALAGPDLRVIRAVHLRVAVDQVEGGF